MRTIAICDDEVFYVEKIADIIKEKLQEEMSYEISCFDNSAEFEVACEKQFFDIIILDIDMPEPSGFEIAKKLSQRQEESLLIFCTGHDEMVYDSFTYQPFWFVRKSELDDALSEALCKAHQKLLQREKTWNVWIKGEAYTIALNHVMYVDSFQHKIYIHLDNQESIAYRENLSNIEKELQKNGFIRISSGCIVNVDWIQCVKKSEIYLKKNDEKPLMISRGKITDVKQMLHRYMREGIV